MIHPTVLLRPRTAARPTRRRDLDAPAGILVALLLSLLLFWLPLAVWAVGR